MTSGPLATATAALVLALALALGDLCAAAPAAPQCDMAAGPWIFVGNRGLSSRLFYATDLDTSGAFNMTFDIRHGPGVIPGRVSGNEVTVDLSPQCKGIISTNCNRINWTTPCMTDLWCRAWTDGCESPPPPYGQGFSFFSVFSSNMVLQQAPAQAAVYGIVVGNPTNVSVTVTGGGDSYTVQATVGPNATHQPFGPEFVGGESGYPGPFVTWKALLRPTEAGGNYTIYANCQGCTQSGVYENVTLYNVTFGDVWHCSGQSNMWLPLENSFQRNNTIGNITQLGKYHNIRMAVGDSGTGVTNLWMSAEQAASQAPPPNRGDPNPLPYIETVGAACFYFAQRLTDEMEKSGTVIPIGLTNTAIGGQRIEEYMRNNSDLYMCSNRTGENSPEWNGRLFGQQTIPFVDMTVKGWLWYQGENNMGGVKGNVDANVGYACEMRQLVRQWRAIWSQTPNTTDPLAPFGIVTLASSGSEGGPNMGAMRQAQTGSYGVLPNPQMPNTFMAQAYDLDDEWGANAGPCNHEWACCSYNDGVAGHCTYNATACHLGTKGNTSLCDNACAASEGTPVRMGGIHPRSKKQVGDRLGLAAFNTVYGGKGAYTGPTLSSCSVQANKLVIQFNTTLLRGDSVVMQPYNNTQLSFLDVQTDAAAFCMEPLSIGGGNKTCPAWAGGSASTNTSAIGDGWTRLNITLASSSTVAVDLTPLNGTAPTAVRYAWGIVDCCNTADPLLYITHGCIANCPIMSTSGFPANPFMAKIVDGKCECVAPQECSG